MFLFVSICIHAICFSVYWLTADELYWGLQHTPPHPPIQIQREGESMSKNNHHLISSSKFWVGSLSLQDWSWRGVVVVWMGGWEPPSSSSSLNKAERGFVCQSANKPVHGNFGGKLRKSHFTHYQLYNKRVGQCENMTSRTAWPALHATASTFIQELSLGKNLTHTTDQIVSLFLPGCFALNNPIFSDQASSHCTFFFPFLFSVMPCVGVPPPCTQWGSPAMAAVYSTVTVDPSEQGAMSNNGCPRGLNWKWLCAYINTLLWSHCPIGCI